MVKKSSCTISRCGVLVLFALGAIHAVVWTSIYGSNGMQWSFHEGSNLLRQIFSSESVPRLDSEYKQATMDQRSRTSHLPIYQGPCEICVAVLIQYLSPSTPSSDDLPIARRWQLSTYPRHFHSPARDPNVRTGILQWVLQLLPTHPE